MGGALAKICEDVAVWSLVLMNRYEYTVTMCVAVLPMDQMQYGDGGVLQESSEGMDFLRTHSRRVARSLNAYSIG